jgi:hypothetical protein
MISKRFLATRLRGPKPAAARGQVVNRAVGKDCAPAKRSLIGQGRGHVSDKQRKENAQGDLERPWRSCWPLDGRKDGAQSIHEEEEW